MYKNRKFFERFGFACDGIRATSKEPSFRFQLLAACGVLFLLVWFRPEPHWWAILLLPVGGVLGAEMLNTAIESLLDKLHPEIHPEIRIAKDCAAAAVLTLSMTSLAVLAAFLCHVWCG